MCKQMELFSTETMRRECMDCGRCYGYKVGGVPYECEECSPDCDLRKNHEVYITTGLCENCFAIRTEEFMDELANK